MSYVNGALLDCSKLQEKITDRFYLSSPSEFMPFFEFVNSEINNRGLSYTVNPGNGKVRTVTLKYTPRQVESSLLSNVANPKCDITNFVGDRYQDYTIDTGENRAWGFSISPTDLERACVDNAMYVEDRILDGIDVLDRGLATLHSQDLLANVGKWSTDVTVNGSNEFQVNTLQTSSTQIDPQTIAKIDFALAKTSYTGPKMIFSGNTLAEYYRATSLAGCCTEQGIDISTIYNQFGVAVAYDKRVATALGDQNKAVVVQAGAVTLLNYTVSDWKAGMSRIIRDGANYTQYVVTSPRTGVNYDLTIKDDCGNISFALVGTTKLVTLPMDLFREGDNLLGVNWIGKIKVVNA